MIKCEYLIPARAFALDRFTDALSIFEVLDELKPAGYPAFLSKLVVMGVFTREASDPASIRPTLRIGMDDDLIVEDTFNVHFDTKFRARAFVVLQGIPVFRPGSVGIRVMHEGVEMGSCQMKLHLPAADTLLTEKESTQPPSNAEDK